MCVEDLKSKFIPNIKEGILMTKGDNLQMFKDMMGGHFWPSRFPKENLISPLPLVSQFEPLRKKKPFFVKPSLLMCSFELKRCQKSSDPKKKKKV